MDVCWEDSVRQLSGSRAPCCSPQGSSTKTSTETADMTSAKGRLFISQVSTPLNSAVLRQGTLTDAALQES